MPIQWVKKLNFSGIMVQFSNEQKLELTYSMKNYIVCEFQKYG